ncbi:TPA: glycosyltransferase [Vibrio alginolyticus]|uniref:glycosyltransferase n=1 Tax=Vibrio alginolyticus TaxID=663 RepID=UPI001BD5744E|nr:glycosyltransferase [Vibrio alginolyticus]ELB2737846.1 glycosyltransferase [Vibrio alginolyticus]MBS9881888.1 glycosyltransferase [Vibrio alginolyticus]MCR9896955.1 glycosyltransferase [Vibrio alginolyticus]
MNKEFVSNISNEKISVLMSLYDKESPKFLMLCLDSLVEQTRTADEVVIVYDGTINQSLDNVVSRYLNILPIKVVKISTNVGLGAALNEGLKHCSGSLIARMDTDDICRFDRFERQERYLLENDLDIVGSAAQIIDFQGFLRGSRVNPLLHDEILRSLWCNPFIHPSVMYKRIKIQEIGGYNITLRRRQDYELWFRAAKHGFILGNLADKLIEYRFDNHTLRKQSPKLAWQQGVIGFRGSMSCDLGIFKSLTCFVPFFRSLLPFWLQNKVTNLMQYIDKRASS